MDVSLAIKYKNNNGQFEQNVTLWVNPDKTISLLGNIPHGTQIIINQKLVDDLQKLIDMGVK